MIDNSTHSKYLGWKFFYCLVIVLIGHFKQYRKHPKAGIDGVFRLPHYYGHLFRVCGLVMERGGSENAVLLALIHDLLEDTNIPKWLLLPLGKSLVRKVEILTQNPNLPKPLRKIEYCNKLVVSSDLDAFLVAICDKWDNWQCYEVEGNIPQDVIEYYLYFIQSLGNVCSFSLLHVLKESVDKAKIKLSL